MLNEDTVSKEHAWIVPLDTGVVVIDRGSANGTYVNSTESPRVSKVGLAERRSRIYREAGRDRPDLLQFIGCRLAHAELSRPLQEIEMAKFCSNGHQMEDSWEICPYCQRTGFAGLHEPSAAGQDTPGRTGRPGALPPPRRCPRKTVLLTEQRKAPVVGWFVAMDGEQKGEDFRDSRRAEYPGLRPRGRYRYPRRHRLLASRQPALQGPAASISPISIPERHLLNESRRVARPRRTAR